jgi:hypothetical protein
VTWGNLLVETLWEPVPRVGAWASLARRDGDQPSLLSPIQQPDPDADAAPGVTPQANPMGSMEFAHRTDGQTCWSERAARDSNPQPPDP